ncbi:MAG: hypothetical protein CMO55_01405 [Verrucomicrobiales bacterium]|nr:hypothetical protein [Verrucomicrobiales bacterium]
MDQHSPESPSRVQGLKPVRPGSISSMRKNSKQSGGEIARPTETERKTETIVKALEVNEITQAEKTVEQLNRIVSEYLMKYPEHTQSVPTVQNGEDPLIAIVRQLVSSLSKRNEMLVESADQAREAATAKQEFLANMSHEIRTPMNAIFGMVNLLIEDDELSLRQKEYLETVRSSSELLLSVLNDVLDYSKINSRQFVLEPREFSPRELIIDVMRSFRAMAKEKGLDMHADLDVNLPEYLIADDLRLRQVFANLINNAIKFTSHGEIIVRALLMSEPGGADAEIRFDVTDTGIGMSPETQERLFQPFSQADASTTRMFGGTGLGLAISSNLVDLMGGEISVRSEPGVGSCFKFTLRMPYPSAQKKDEPRSAPKQPEVTGRKSNPDDTLTVLLVEDNEINQRVAGFTLNRLGCDVQIANNGEQAVEMARNGTAFDLICMDVQMPVMDGFEATRRIRESGGSNAETFILAMTGLAFQEDMERCLEAGMNDVMTKPIDINKLRKKVSEIAEGRATGVSLPR